MEKLNFEHIENSVYTAELLAYFKYTSLHSTMIS